MSDSAPVDLDPAVASIVRPGFWPGRPTLSWRPIASVSRALAPATRAGIGHSPMSRSVGFDT